MLFHRYGSSSTYHKRNNAKRTVIEFCQCYICLNLNFTSFQNEKWRTRERTNEDPNIFRSNWTSGGYAHAVYMFIRGSQCLQIFDTNRSMPHPPVDNFCRVKKICICMDSSFFFQWLKISSIFFRYSVITAFLNIFLFFWQADAEIFEPTTVIIFFLYRWFRLFFFYFFSSWWTPLPCSLRITGISPCWIFLVATPLSLGGSSDFPIVQLSSWTSVCPLYRWLNRIKLGHMLFSFNGQFAGWAAFFRWSLFHIPTQWLLHRSGTRAPEGGNEI